MGRAVAAVAVGLILASPAAARAADGIRLGPLRAHPELEVRVEHDDNVFLEPSGGVSDTVTRVAPALRLVLPVRRFSFEAEAGAEVVRHRDLAEEDATNWKLGAALGAAFPGGLEFELSDRHRESYLTTSQEFGAGEDSSVNEALLRVGYQIRDALRLEIRAARTGLRYEESTDRERDETGVSADFFWRVLPRTSAFVEAGHTDFDYLAGESRQDGTETHGALGLAWAATGRSTGSVKAGLQRKAYDVGDAEAGLEDATTWIVAASLRHLFTRRTAASLLVSRGTRESDFPENPYFERTAAEASLTQRVTAKIYGRAAVRYEREDYPNDATYDNPADEIAAETGGRTDDMLGASLALGFDVLPWLNLEARWQGQRRRSSFEALEYDVNRLAVAVTAAF